MIHKITINSLVSNLILCSQECNHNSVIFSLKEEILKIAKKERLDISDWTNEFIEFRSNDMSEQDIKNYHLYLAGSLLHYFAGSPIEENGDVFTKTYAFLHFITSKNRKEVESE